jgi:hypothetical protein
MDGDGNLHARWGGGWPAEAQAEMHLFFIIFQ